MAIRWSYLVVVLTADLKRAKWQKETAVNSVDRERCHQDVMLFSEKWRRNVNGRLDTFFRASPVSPAQFQEIELQKYALCFISLFSYLL